jgi:hypothetical protein
MNLHPDKYRCNHCNKNYSSASSLWNHNNKFHKNDIILDNPIIIPNHTLIIPGKNYDCRICQRKFNNFQNRWKHQKICKAKNDELVKSKEELYKIKKEIKKTKTELIKNTTINKQINNNNNNNNNTTNNNNGTINNITINAFGKEDVTLLGIPEIKKLIKNNNPLIDIISLLNFNENLPENHSFCNTSLEGDYVSVINTDNNKIEKKNKHEFYDKVLNSSFDKIDQISIILELDNDIKELLKDKYKKHLDKKMIHIKNTFFTDKVYQNSYKTNINELSYNNKDMISNTWSKLNKTINDDDSISTLDTDESLLSE